MTITCVCAAPAALTEQVTDATADVFLADSTGTSQNPYWLSFVRKDRLEAGLIDTVRRDIPGP